MGNPGVAGAKHTPLNNTDGDYHSISVLVTTYIAGPPWHLRRFPPLGQREYDLIGLSSV